ncbi:hypothetical protein V5799_033056, partial [Amblyomma americanum]
MGCGLIDSTMTDRHIAPTNPQRSITDNLCTEGQPTGKPVNYNRDSEPYRYPTTAK